MEGGWSTPRSLPLLPYGMIPLPESPSTQGVDILRVYPADKLISSLSALTTSPPLMLLNESVSPATAACTCRASASCPPAR